jgi:hypothetical protein
MVKTYNPTPFARALAENQAIGRENHVSLRRLMTEADTEDPHYHTVRATLTVRTVATVVDPDEDAEDMDIDEPVAYVPSGEAAEQFVVEGAVPL